MTPPDTPEVAGGTAASTAADKVPTAMEDLPPTIHELQDYTEQKLRDYLDSAEPALEGLLESIHYTLFSGGKRIRPIFCFLVGELFNTLREKLTALACSLEMIHTSSLIMDDLPHMDNGTLRRGKRANHLVYGQDVASLASIALLAKAYELVLNDPGLTSEKKSIIVDKLVRTVGMQGMVGGQYADLKLLNDAADLAMLEFIHLHKTASLFIAAGETAAIAGDASDDEIRAIKSYAGHLGFAFQILDDLLDAVGKTCEVNKSLQHDRTNFVTLLGVERSKQLIEEHTGSAVEAIEIFGGRAARLVMLSQLLLRRKS